MMGAGQREDGQQKGAATVRIDRDRCSRCGLCTTVCPHRLLHLDDECVVVGDGNCMGCGHCQAICAAGAVAIDGLSARLGLQRIEEHLTAIAPGEYDCDELVRLMRSRRSCRNYSRRPVELALLEDLVRVATTAPSGTNSQSWDFVILPGRGDVEVLGGQTAEFYRQLNRRAANPLIRLLAGPVAGRALAAYYRNHAQAVAQALRDWDEAGVDRLFHGAPAAILVTGKRWASCPAEDALLATQNILLAAHALGLGTCLIGYVVEAMRRSRRIRRLMALAADEEVYSVIGIGYPAVRYGQVAGRRPVRPRVLHLSSATGKGRVDRQAEPMTGD